jgi:hypothetical protein
MGVLGCTWPECPLDNTRPSKARSIPLALLPPGAAPPAASAASASLPPPATASPHKPRPLNYHQPVRTALLAAGPWCFLLESPRANHPGCPHHIIHQTSCHIGCRGSFLAAPPAVYIQTRLEGVVLNNQACRSHSSTCGLTTRHVDANLVSLRTVRRTGEELC